MQITNRSAKKVVLALVAKLASTLEITMMFDSDNAPAHADLLQMEKAKNELVAELMRRAGLTELPQEPAEYLALTQN